MLFCCSAVLLFCCADVLFPAFGPPRSDFSMTSTVHCVAGVSSGPDSARSSVAFRLCPAAPPGPNHVPWPSSSTPLALRPLPPAGVIATPRTNNLAPPTTHPWTAHRRPSTALPTSPAPPHLHTSQPQPQQHCCMFRHRQSTSPPAPLPCDRHRHRPRPCLLP